MKYRTILADPPWPYKGSGPVGNGGRGSQDGRAKSIIQVNAATHYNLMSLANIRDLQIEQLADDAHLYLWTTNSFISQAHRIVRAWGFLPKTVLTWVKVHKTDSSKPSMKTGYYYRGATEHIVFGVRGSLRLSGPATPTAFLLPRDYHSKKPDFFYTLIEQQSPGPYLELFARKPRMNWDSWGNEVESTIQISGKNNE